MAIRRQYVPVVDEDQARKAILETIAAHFGLGTVEGSPVQQHGGVNTLWRIQTQRGDFAVHEMAVVADELDQAARCQRAFDLEVAAAAAGVAIAQPVTDPLTGQASAAFPGLAGPVVVHRWVDAKPVQLGRTTLSAYEVLGRSLAQIHNLNLDIVPPSRDALYRHPTVDEWRELAQQGHRFGWAWAASIDRAATELVEGLATVDDWDRSCGESPIFSHRDLTSSNILDADDGPVLIDWEDAGLIQPGTEVGRTALDNFGRDGSLDVGALSAYLMGYQAVLPLPAVGRHWCSLWIRGLIVFAEHCARSCVSGLAPPALLDRQSAVVGSTVTELRRRLQMTDALVAAFNAALPPTAT